MGFDHTDDGCIAQDNHCDHYARALLHYKWGACTVRSLNTSSVRHVSLTPPQCILDFMPHNCQFLSPYHSSICSSLTTSACQFVRFTRTLLFAPFFFVLIPTYFFAFMALSVHAFLLLCFPHGHHRFFVDLTPGIASAPSSLRRPKMESPFQSLQLPRTLVGMVLEA